MHPTITISKYVNVTFTSASNALDITISDGGLSGTYTSGTANFTAKSNTAFTISSSVTGYTGPGTLAVNNFTFTNPNGATAGTNGSLKVQLTGLSTSTPTSVTTNTSATVTVTVTAT